MDCGEKSEFLRVLGGVLRSTMDRALSESFSLNVGENPEIFLAGFEPVIELWKNFLKLLNKFWKKIWDHLQDAFESLIHTSSQTEIASQANPIKPIFTSSTWIMRTTSKKSTQKPKPKIISLIEWWCFSFKLSFKKMKKMKLLNMLRKVGSCKHRS